MESLDPDFPKKAKPGDIIVAGKNFGCGSSREHAPLCIKALGISCVVARSFARIFYRNAINIGLPLLECPEGLDKINEGDILEIDLSEGKIYNKTSGITLYAKPFPPFMQEIMLAGGLMNWVKRRFLENL